MQGAQGRSGGREGQPQTGSAMTFDAASWAPAKREYGLLHLLVRRSVMSEELAKPLPSGRLKALDARQCAVAQAAAQAAAEAAQALSPPRQEVPETFDDEDDDVSDISEGEPHEPNEFVSWGKGQRGAWWRVRTSLREDLVVRAGISLVSAELRRTAPGEMLQQKGRPRVLTRGRARGCIRMPIQPCGWVTADASRIGGPQYLFRAHAPRWRAIYQSPNRNGKGDVLVRSGQELDSEAVVSLLCGNIVEQGGPAEVRPDGIIRMRITACIGRGVGDGDEAGSRADEAGSKVSGWITVDASAAGGPVFFKLIPEDNGTAKKRGPRQSQAAS
mmetsp:Transcript_37938/g.80657  ORF Transcript_37938/g.80657 Transcript_37938/m.80657 type:complete len:330 (-) Transcript_37938:52-1041(-)